MTTIATLGTEGSLDWEAARRYRPEAQIRSFPHISAMINAFSQGRTDLAIIPAYNTRDGENKEFLRAMAQLESGCWVDNLVMPIHLSLGAVDEKSAIDLVIGKPHLLKQCSEFFTDSFPDASIMATQNLEQDLAAIVRERKMGCGVIAPEKVLEAHGLVIREREVAPFNRTRYAILGRKPAASTGYDATVMITRPLRDRVGLLYDILGEFSRRGISLLDMRTESDLKTQELLFYMEAEGHIEDQKIKLALERIENHIIQEPGAIRILGSFPRIDMRTKLISNVGFIGTGDMSKWFAERLENEGYTITMTGRSTKTTPEEMIGEVEVVIICVPISATPATIEQYGPLLKDGQALVIMAGEAENTLDTALTCCAKGVEVMLVHNLWGPKAATMKDKNVSVVKTPRSGVLCSEFESFLYKHGSIICKDTPVQHDLLMGFSQKLPTAISMAMAMALKDNNISTDEIGGHSTLTSLYGLLAMCRVHAQNPRTYGEILCTRGAGRKIVRDFVKNLTAVLDLSEDENIAELCNIIEESRGFLSEDFLSARMKQALAVDETLGRVIKN
ncbi:MAG: prephenate dehydrogenase/arogenate dehydrogenase family protein [Proteobacteria bacterium]|nr:prephenate dehydrogenase/arogenate dehydrogenase family protein [Pseudomonadota bacterium]MBU1739698.1 prephenate dehydrogenase/arogenate dehydrogenase family protein [Pseudomonadota bacterium]